MKSHEEIIIVGGGLSGLTLAWLLSKRNIRATVLEASSRLGGRIHTVKGTLGTPLELGATWFSAMHPGLFSLIEELGLTKYPQYSGGMSLFQTKSFEPPQKFFVPEAESPSYRIAGGTQTLIDTIAQKLPAENIHLNARITAVKNTEDKLSLETADGRKWKADKLILCIPPQLAGSKIRFTPELPDNLRLILPAVQTWMAGTIKFTLEYADPFWRKKGYSGMLYSHAGIVVEMYDHTNFEENRFGLTGFLNGSAASFTPEVRKELVLDQLSGLMGAEIAPPVAYYDKVWDDDLVMDGTPLLSRPHQNNGHPALHASYMNSRLHFCGTETSAVFPGYMEGAVVAARTVAEKL